MNPLNPQLERILSLARSGPAAPSRRLEILVIAAWRDWNSVQDSVYPLALACACGLFVMALLGSYSLLAEPASPTILLANAALQEVIHP